MHLLPVLQRDAEAGNTLTGSPWRRWGALNRVGAPMYSGSANYSEFTGICLPKLQRAEDTCITPAFLPRPGTTKDRGRKHCWSKGLDRFISVRSVCRGRGLRGCAKLRGTAAKRRISWMFCGAEKQGRGRKLCRWRQRRDTEDGSTPVWSEEKA